jgi:hypothetical protein
MKTKAKDETEEKVREQKAMVTRHVQFASYVVCDREREREREQCVKAGVDMTAVVHSINLALAAALRAICIRV